MPQRRTVARRISAPTATEAARAWRANRRAYWALTRYTEIPLQSGRYDGLTRTGRDVFWHTLEHDFSADRVQAALAEDAAAVARFRRVDPRGAEAIAEYLEAWLCCLSHWDFLAVSLARETDRWAPRGYYRKISAGSQYTYGEILRARLDLTVITEAVTIGDTDSQQGEDD